jgi:hypothetical protein
VPDILHRIEFRRISWQRDQCDVGWNFQFLAALMPSGTVTDQGSVRASPYLRADLLQMLVHRLGIGDRHDDRGPDPATRADCAKQIDRIMTIVPHCGLPRSYLCPAVREAEIQENYGEVPGRLTDQGDRPQIPSKQNEVNPKSA